MRSHAILYWAFLAAPLSVAGSLDFAISANLSSPYSRFAVDLQGNILIASAPSACNLPTVNPLSTCGPIWIGKLDASGQTLLFATYLGSGLSNDIATTEVAGIAADANGNMIVAAHAVIQNLPTVNAIQSAPASQFYNLYMAKLSADGSRLLYATYLGGSGAQEALSLAVDGAGAAYVAATLSTPDFPTTPQSAHDPPGLYSTAIAKLGPDGKLLYGVTFPFEFYSNAKPIQLDAMGDALLASNLESMTVAPDGSSLTRAPLPAWAAATAPWVIPRLSGGLFYAGTALGSIPVTPNALQTYNDANNYTRIEDGLARQPQLPSPVNGIVADPRDRNRIYAATSGGLFVSTDNGWDWSLVRSGACLAIAVDPFDSTRLYLGVNANPQMYRSTDRGASWTAIANGLSSGARIKSLAADPNVQGLLYGAGGSVFRSVDGGDTWDARSVGPTRPDISPSASIFTASEQIQADAAHPGWAYVVGTTACIGFCPVTRNLSRTQDGGNTWTNATIGADPLASAGGALAVDPNTGDVVEALTNSNAGSQVRIYRGGDFSAPQVLYAAEATSVAFDVQWPGTIYLAVHISQGNGSGYFVIKSVDDGATWTNVVQLDRPAYNLTVGAGAVLHASQIADPPEGYLVTADNFRNMLYGSYIGGAFTQVNSAAASGGTLFVAGVTQGGLPLTGAAQPSIGGGVDGFVAAFDNNGALLWSTYLGGSADDSIDWALPLPDGSAIVVGTTNSTDFPMLQTSPLGADSTFIAHVRP